MLKYIFLISLLHYVCEWGVRCDCGFPGMPVHMKVRPLVGIYYEDSLVEYYCEFKHMILIGNPHRQCRKSRWTGDIPQCVHEIPRRFVDRIELVNVKNHTVSNVYRSLIYDYNYLNNYAKYQSMTFYGDPTNPGECVHSKVKADVTRMQWRVVFKWTIGQVYHVSVVVDTTSMKQTIDTRKTSSVISEIYVSDYRECKAAKTSPETVDTNEKVLKYTFICDLKDQSNGQKLEDFQSIRSEDLKNITITFAVNEITVCELHVAETLPIRYYSRGSCGSPDIPLYSSYVPVWDETTNGVIPIGYTFTCDKGFQLDGNQVVTCGINNQWLDKFPTCLPINTCPTMDGTKLDELSLKVEYRNLYSVDGNITAINGTQAIYSCNPHTKDDDNVNKTLLGDSVQFCQIMGNWSGEEPVCLDENDFTLYLSEFNEDILTMESKHPEYAHHQHRPNQCGIPAIPKYSRIYTHDPNLIGVYLAAIKGKLDLMPSYPNGSVMTYGCESKFDYMASDFDARTCVNGSWVGPVGKCFTPVGGTDVTRVIAIQENTGLANVSYHNIRQDMSDRYWSYMETEDTNCTQLEIKSGTVYTWTIYLSTPVRMSYFAVRFANTKIFHDLDDDMLRVHRASQLDTPSPISAELFGYNYWSNKLGCEVTKVIETGLTSGLTQVSFRCDEPDSEASKKKMNPYVYYGYQMTTSAINIKINSDAFHESFDSTNTTHVNLCALMLFRASDDCGLPEDVPNSEIISSHEEGYVRYKCNPGYKLVGNEYVRCSKLGNWMDEFPRCELYKLCEMNKTNSPHDVLQRKYFNTMVINGEEVAVLATIAEFKCRNENLETGKHVIIGPRTIVCTKSGHWSTDEPICADDAYFGRFVTSNQTESSVGKVVAMVIFAVILVAIVGVLVFAYHRKYGFSNPCLTCMTGRETARRSSTFISYGQSNLRDSVISYNEGSVSSSNSFNNNERINANLIKI